MNLFLEKKWKSLKTNGEKKQKKGIIKRNILLSRIVAVIFILISIIILVIHFITPADVFLVSVFLGFIGIILFFAVKNYYKNMLSDFLKLQVAKEKGWFYSPNKKKDEQRQNKNRSFSSYKPGKIRL